MMDTIRKGGHDFYIMDLFGGRGRICRLEKETNGATYDEAW